SAKDLSSWISKAKESNPSALLQSVTLKRLTDLKERFSIERLMLVLSGIVGGQWKGVKQAPPSERFTTPPAMPVPSSSLILPSRLAGIPAFYAVAAAHIRLPLLRGSTNSSKDSKA